MRSRSSGARSGWLRGLILMLGAAIASLTIGATAAAQAPPDSEFEKVTLNDTPGEPMDLAALPGGRVLHTTRPGELWLHDPKTGLNTLAAEFDVYRHDEEGLQSVALDPNFKKTKRIYVYYSPPLDTPVDDPATAENEGDAPEVGTEDDWEPFRGVIRLSTFKLQKDRVKMKSERQILDVPVDRGICCHVGGDIVFDSAGNLILSTGDDTNPFESDGFTPIDERADRNPAFDAQRTAANTNDLRGKILRIKPKAKKGGYEVPEGNLFEEGTEGTRPRSTRWASATRSGSRSMPSTTRSTSATTRRTVRWPTRSGAPPGRGSGPSSASPATTAGLTAQPRRCPTSITTSPPSNPPRRSTARIPSTSRPTTPG